MKQKNTGLKQTYSNNFLKPTPYRNTFEKIDRYVNLVFKTLDPDDEVYVHYEEENGSQFVRIEVLDRVLH